MSSSAKFQFLGVCMTLLLALTSARDDPQKFKAAYDKTSLACKTAINTCIILAPWAEQLYLEDKYCEIFEYKNGEPAKTCLVQDPGCTQAEYNSLKKAVCDRAGSMVVSIAVVVVSLVASVFSF